MNIRNFTAADFVATVSTTAALTLSLKEWLEICLLAFSIAAMAPLAFWRLRAVWREARTGKTSTPPTDEKRN